MCLFWGSCYEGLCVCFGDHVRRAYVSVLGIMLGGPMCLFWGLCYEGLCVCFGGCTIIGREESSEGPNTALSFHCLWLACLDILPLITYFTSDIKHDV
jgi:hypothetical protein